MSLIAWYPLNGDTKDYSGNNFHLNDNGNTINNDGKIGKCYSFTTNTPMTYTGWILPQNSVYNDFTVTAWIYPTETPTAHGYNVVSFGQNKVLRFRLNPNNRIWAIWGGSNTDTTFASITSSTVLSLNKWYHIAFRIKNGKGSLFINGKYDVGNSDAKQIDYVLNTLFIGGFKNGVAYEAWKGRLNDIRIYNHALTGKEIKEISQAKLIHCTCNEKFIEPTDNLYANYPDTGNLNNTNDNNIYAIKEKIGPGHFRYRIEKKVDGNYWPNVQFPVYAFEAGENYSIGIDIKLIEKKNQAQLELRHAVVNNDYGTDGRKSVWIENAPIGVWKRYNLTRKINSTHIQSGIEHNTSPRIEIFTHMNKAGDVLEFEIKNYQVEKKDHSTPFTANSRNAVLKNISEFPLADIVSMENVIAPIWQGKDPVLNKSYIHIDDKACFKVDNTGYGKLQEFTYSCWLKTTDGLAFNVMGFPSGTNNTSISLSIIDGKLAGHTYASAPNSNLDIWYGKTTKTINDNKWHMLSMTYDGKEIKTYIDGQYNNKTTVTLDFSRGNYQTFAINLNSRDSLGNYENRRFNGDISDIRVYATALSDEDIKLLYQPEISIDKSNTVRCNEIIENDQIIYENIFIQSASHALVSKVDFKGISYAGSRSWNILCINKFLDVTCNKRYDIYNSGNYITELLNELDDFINNNEYCVIWTYDEPNNNSTNIRAKLKVLGATLTESNKWSHRCAYLIVFNKNKILDEKIIEGPSNIINTTLTLQGVSKYGFNKNASISYNEFNEIPKIESGIHNLKLGDEVLPVLIDMDNDGGRWARVFYHNCKAGTVLFSSDNSFAEAKETNKNAPTTSDKYSILSKLEYFRFGNKTSFEFRLRYPTDYHIKNSDKRNKWIMKEYTNINYNNANRYPVLEDIKNKVPTSTTIVEDTTNFLNSNTRNYFIQHYSSNVYCMNEKTITLGIQSDDATTMYVNDKIITQVKNTAGFTNISFTLSAGWNKIDVLFYENTGNEILKFNTMLSSLVDGMNYDIEETQSCNIWRQLNNPIYESINGYKPISISWTTNCWGGLELSTAPQTLINGSVNHINWFYTIGACAKHENGIPSYVSTANDVELWVKINDYGLFNDNYIKNVSISKDNIIAANEFIEINI